MKVIKLNHRHHGSYKWTHAIEFTKHEMHWQRRKHGPYLRAFKEIYGEDSWLDTNTTNWWTKRKFNDHWFFDDKRRRIYFKDSRVMTLVELKIA